jgi:membrane fusion protein (multidrug efflux system)
MKVMIITLTIVFGGIFLWNVFRHYMIEKFLAENQSPPVTISATTAKTENWFPYLTTIGTLAAINGVSISTQIGGIVTAITFNSGQHVKKGELLIKLDDTIEQADLLNNEAQLKLAQLNYQRNATLFKKHAVSEQNYDQALAQYTEAQAAVEKTQAIIAQKNITAPFDGKIGIRNVNIGQYVSPGTALVSLQSLDPLYVNFYLPEQELRMIQPKQAIQLQIDAYPHQFFLGQLNAVDSLVNVQTHNIKVQAIIPNKQEQLYPGLFATIKVLLPKLENAITVPQTAIAYSLFGNSVFLIQQAGKDEKGKPILRVTQTYVTIGEERDNKVVVLKGLKSGDLVATSGQLKLDNGTQVLINNSVLPN